MGENIKTANRLKEALSDAGLSAADLSRLSGVSKASISQYYNGTYVPSNVSSGRMAKVLGVSPVWLMGFDVPKTEQDTNHTQDPQSQLTTTPDPQESTLLNYFHQLNYDGKNEVIKHAEYILSRDEFKKGEISDFSENAG